MRIEDEYIKHIVREKETTIELYKDEKKNETIKN